MLAHIYVLIMSSVLQLGCYIHTTCTHIWMMTMSNFKNTTLCINLFVIIFHYAPNVLLSELATLNLGLNKFSSNSRS